MIIAPHVPGTGFEDVIAIRNRFGARIKSIWVFVHSTWALVVTRGESNNRPRKRVNKSMFHVAKSV